MDSFLKHAAEIIEKAGATVLTLYALILLCGFFLIYSATKRSPPFVALAAGFVWLFAATGLLVLFVQPKPAGRATAAPNAPAATSPAFPAPAVRVNLSGQAPVAAMAYSLDLGDIPDADSYRVNLAVTSAVPVSGAVLKSGDAGIEAS